MKQKNIRPFETGNENYMKYLDEALQWQLNIQVAQCASGNSDVQDEEEKKISGSEENQITSFFRQGVY